MSSAGSPEASAVSRRPWRTSFAPSLVSGVSQDKPSPKWFQRNNPGMNYKKRPSQRTVVSTMTPRQKRLWRLQLLAIKKQQAFQEAIQSIPVSEMEKMIAAAGADLERASENYDRFLLVNQGKGRYLWSKLRDLVATMDAETKLRIQLLPVIPLERDLAASTSAPAAAGIGSSASGSQSAGSSKATSPRSGIAGSSKSGTPRSVAAGSSRGSRAGNTPRGIGGGTGGAGSKLGTPQSLLRAAAAKAATGQQPTKVEITKRPPQTVFKWRSSLHVKLATDLPQELLRHRHDHEFDKYNSSSILTASTGSARSPHAAAGGSSMDGRQGEYAVAGAQPHTLSRCSSNSSRPASRVDRVAPPKLSSSSTASRFEAGWASRVRPSPAAGAGPKASGDAPAVAQRQLGPASTSTATAAHHYGEQWAVPPKLWKVCSAARLQDEDPVIMRIEQRNFPVELAPAAARAAAQAAAGSGTPPLVTAASSRLPRHSVNIKQRELQEKISVSVGAQTYARHLQRAGKRLPEYLQNAIQEEERAEQVGPV